MLRGQHRIALLLFGLALSLWVTGLGTVLSIAPREIADRTYIVIFQPAITAERGFLEIARAGGRPLRPTALSPVWIMVADSQSVAARLSNVTLAVLRLPPLGVSFPICAVSAVGVSRTFAVHDLFL